MGVLTTVAGGATDQLVRMSGPNTMQVSSVALSDAGDLATVTTIATVTPISDKSMVVEVVYTGRQQSSVNSNCGKLDREFYNNVTTLYAMGPGTWSSSNYGGNSGTWQIAINPSSGSALIQVTGEAATNIDWKVLYRYLQSR